MNNSLSSKTDGKPRRETRQSCDYQQISKINFIPVFCLRQRSLSHSLLRHSVKYQIVNGPIYIIFPWLFFRDSDVVWFAFVIFEKKKEDKKKKTIMTLQKCVIFSTMPPVLLDVSVWPYKSLYFNVLNYKFNSPQMNISSPLINKLSLNHINVLSIGRNEILFYLRD